MLKPWLMNGRHQLSTSTSEDEGNYQVSRMDQLMASDTCLEATLGRGKLDEVVRELVPREGLDKVGAVRL